MKWNELKCVKINEEQQTSWNVSAIKTFSHLLLCKSKQNEIQSENNCLNYIDWNRDWFQLIIHFCKLFFHQKVFSKSKIKLETRRAKNEIKMNANQPTLLSHHYLTLPWKWLSDHHEIIDNNSK